MKGNRDMIFNYSPIEIYEMVLSGQIKRFPPHFWTNEFSLDYAQELGEYIVNKYLYNNDINILNNYGNKFINDVHLHSVLKLFNGQAYEYFNFVYPNRFKPWQFKSCPNKYWNKNTAIEATQWLIEEQLKWDESEVKEHLNYKVFSDNKLNGMLSVVYNDSVFEALNTAYPNKYLPWNLSSVPKNYWKNVDNVKSALKWLIEDKLKFSIKEIETNLTIELITQNGLSGLLRWYNGIPFDILKNIYPNINLSNIEKHKERYKNVKKD